jgi:drug/metabolite transporter (DMT)-like permease
MPDATPAATAARPAGGGLSDGAIFVILTLVWGTTWAAIRVALAGIPPLTGVAIRFGFAGILLLSLAAVRGIPIAASRRERRIWIVNAIFSFGISYGLVYWAEQRVPSGLAAVVFATFPLWVALLGHFALPGEPLTVRRAAAVLLGIAGIGVLFSEDFGRLGGPGVLGASAILLAAPLASATANVFQKRLGAGIPAVPMAGGSMLLSAIGLAPIAWLAERHRPISWEWAPWAATLYLAVAGSALTFTLYFRLLARRSAATAALVSLTAPVVAVFVGAVTFGEPVTARTALGSLVVLLGVGLAVRAPGRTG